MTELYNLVNSIADNKLLVFITSTLLGFLLNYLLSLAGFVWLKTFNQKMIYIIFPPAMTVISWTISGNLGLSLGMIGALSIVRFRTPVKSPIELIFYFVLIVIGISITVAPIYTLLIFLLTSFAPFVFKYFYKLEYGSYDFTENEDKLSQISVANYVINSNQNDLVNKIKDLNIKLLDFKEDGNNNFNISIEIESLQKYNEIKNQLAECGKILKSEFIS